MPTAPLYKKPRAQGQWVPEKGRKAHNAEPMSPGSMGPSSAIQVPLGPRAYGPTDPGPCPESLSRFDRSPEKPNHEIAPCAQIGPVLKCCIGSIWAQATKGLQAQTGPGPTHTLGQTGHWAQMGPGRKLALRPNGPWARMGPGPTLKLALGPQGPWDPADPVGPKELWAQTGPGLKYLAIVLTESCKPWTLSAESRHTHLHVAASSLLHHRIALQIKVQYSQRTTKMS